MTTNINEYESREDYCAALRRKEWLTPVEYRELVAEALDYGYEYLGEVEGQYRSECAMFGDAGPGQALSVFDTQSRLAEDRALLARLDRIIANTAA